MTSLFKRAVRGLLQGVGFDLVRYHPQTDKWLAQKRLLEGVSAPVVLDVGANVGQSVLAYKKILPGSEIHSFEPFPESFTTLQAVASGLDRVHTHPLAIAEAAGERTFFVNATYHATNSLLPRPVTGRRYYPEGARLDDSITVTCDSLDAVVPRLGIGHINVLKMDIQGGELAALEGAESLLAGQAIDLIVTEVMFVPHYEGGPMFHQVHDFLGDAGYSLFGIYELHFAEDGQLRFGDAIFISRDVRQRLSTGDGPA